MDNNNMQNFSPIDDSLRMNAAAGIQNDRFSKKSDFRPKHPSDMMKQKADYELRPKITVFGVGGAGGNAVNNMIATNVEGCDFVIANTDAQAINQSIAEKRIQLGITITRGLGAGSRPDVGRAAAEEAKEEIQEYLYGSNMVFITAGMGGGTGTGAAPVIAKLAKEQGILTIGVVTKPFHFEGTHRMRLAEKGLQELQKFVDTLIVIPNQNLFRVANDKTTFADAFKMADNVLSSGVRGVTDLMVMPGLINLDFADIRSVMSEMGKAMMGNGEAEGEKKAILAAEAAISNPLLDDISMKGAKGVLINITGGYDMTLYEVDEAANRIRDEVDPEANIIFGSTFDASLDGKMRVSVVATGIDSANKEKSAHDAQKSQLNQQVQSQEAHVQNFASDIQSKPYQSADNNMSSSLKTSRNDNIFGVDSQKNAFDLNDGKNHDIHQNNFNQNDIFNDNVVKIRNNTLKQNDIQNASEHANSIRDIIANSQSQGFQKQEEKKKGLVILKAYYGSAVNIGKRRKVKRRTHRRYKTRYIE